MEIKQHTLGTTNESKKSQRKLENILRCKKTKLQHTEIYEMQQKWKRTFIEVNTHVKKEDLKSTT